MTNTMMITLCFMIGLINKPCWGAHKVDQTSLCSAAGNGHLARVEMLLQARANPNFKDEQDRTPLALAAFNGYEAVVAKLLYYGANKETSIQNGYTPLHCTAMAGHIGIINILLAAGAHKDAVTEDGLTPLQIAIDNDHNSVAAILIKAGAVKSQERAQKFTPLHKTILENNVSALEALLKTNVDINAKISKGLTPLHIAVFRGRTVIVDILIKAGANVECEDDSGNTALIYSLVNVAKEAETRPKEAFADPTITRIFLLFGGASLEKVRRFPLEIQDHIQGRLKAYGFDLQTFESDREKHKKLSKEHSHVLTNLFQAYGIPKVIAAVIFQYHDCIDTRMLLFTKARSDTDVIVS